MTGDPARTGPIWASKAVFLLAAIGYTVGPGNIWRFPYLAGENGGSAFVLLYLAAVAVIVLPILIAELLVGRRGRGSAPMAIRTVAETAGRSPHWSLVGWLGLASTFVVVSFLGVISGWILAYLVKAVSGSLTGLDTSSAVEIFEDLMADGWQMSAWYAAILAITGFVVARGLHRGVEAAAKALTPLIPLLLLVLVAHGAVAGDLRAALAFLFDFDLKAVDARTALAAVGQAFLSVGIGGAVLITYGSYVARDVSLPRAALTIVAADTLIALMAGLAIFPVVFGHGLDPSSGPGLVFITYPLALSESPAGYPLGIVFFALLLVACLSSIIAALEAVVSAVAERSGASRGLTSGAAAIILWILGLGTVLSFSRWSDLRVVGRTVFELLDYLTLSVSVPIGALLVALFVGWRMPPTVSREELRPSRRLAYRGWLWTLRLAVPLALGTILLSNLW
jgi:NSS family neurotransmitter:Na+ symporter